MEFVEKVKWEKGKESTHAYNILEKVLESMRDLNPLLSIASSELFDENDKLIATYKKGEGLKMVEETKEIAVSEETYEFIKKSGKTFFDMYSEWNETGNARLDSALNELNNLSYTKGATYFLTGLMKGEMKLVKKEKLYRIILKGLHRFEGVQTYSEYVYLKSDGTLAKTKSFDYITVMSENSVKQLPEWAQALAEEVK